MTDAHRYQFQLRQRLTASALNEQDAWTSRMVHELARHLTASDRSSNTGVVNGLLPAATGASMDITVGPGLALFYASSLAAPESRHRWIEILDGESVTVTLDGGDASPRWDVIEIAPGSTAGSGQILDFYNPATGLFTPALSTPLHVCSPAVTVRKGTPSASPKFPAGVAGVIPLAYVYVPAGAATIATQDVLYCRPMLRPFSGLVSPGTITSPGPDYRGGGFALEAAGLTGTLAAEMSGYFDDSPIRFTVRGGSQLTMSITNMDGAALPGTSSNVYFYLVPPSSIYPTGYDASIGEREFYIRNSSRITSAGYSHEQRHAITIVSTKPPAADNRGAPASAGTFTINHPNFGVVAISTELAVYVGSAFFDVLSSQLVPQRVFGSHVGGPRKTGFKIDGDFPIVAPTLASLATSYVGDPDFALPAHVRRVRLVGSWIFAPNTWGWLDITDQFETLGGAVPTIRWEFNNVGASLPDDVAGIDAWIHLNSSQQFTINQADYASGGDCFMYCYEWEDPILALR